MVVEPVVIVVVVEILAIPVVVMVDSCCGTVIGVLVMVVGDSGIGMDGFGIRSG
ncbi:hypothetical protein DPMN_066805 [Dreissena polymorpha]|uniref:Transmembrane protein n=1 Tax=Dreissena polymorpha TaxID=45954 RepID=A0A9D3YZP8_DREPO|nr:hypothetical protein DPMN_066805 [Dreissena polymorpha]